MKAPVFLQCSAIFFDESFSVDLKMLEQHFLTLAVWQWLGLVGALLAGLILSAFFQRVLLALVGRLARLTPFHWDGYLATAGKGPFRLIFWCALIEFTPKALRLPDRGTAWTEPVVRTLMIVSLAWLLLRCVNLFATYVEAKVTRENWEAGRVRGVQTQVAVLRRVLAMATYVISAAFFLIQFQIVRNVGVSLLASAGIAGLVLGLAAQKSISTLLAGIQLSITQPIRIGDSVIVEGEFGTIAEIGLTYVVIKVWDLRRLIVPMTYFLEKPFQNWSKGTDGIMGSANIQVDFCTDLKVVRTEVRRILENEGKTLWDGKVQNVMVTDASDRTMTLRVLVSSTDAGKNFDLRCLIRERIIELLGQNLTWLPKIRNENHNRLEDAEIIK